MSTIFRTSSLLLVLALLVGVPAFAGTVYVPIIGASGLGDEAYTTRVWVTNDGNARVKVETLFLQLGSDGTARDGVEPDTVFIAPGATSVLVVEGRSGLLEVSGPPAVTVSAELRAPGPGAQMVHGNVPVVSSRNAFEGEDVLTLQGLRRTVDGVAGTVAVINLGHEPTQCSVDVFRANGSQIGSTALIELPALSHVYFPDSLRILGEKQLRDAYATISCNQLFYAYLARFEHDTGQIHFSRPSASGESELVPPGSEQPTVPGAVLFTRNGTFHVPNPQNPTEILNVPVPTNKNFSSLVVDLDVFIPGWSHEPRKMHNVFWINRGAFRAPNGWPKWDGNVFGYVNAWGPGLDRVTVETNVDLPKFQRTEFKQSVPLPTGNTYHFRYEYNAANGIISLEISQGGNQVAALASGATTNAIRPDGSGAFMIYFGNKDATGHGPERPSYGWRYQNLRVEFLP